MGKGVKKTIIKYCLIRLLAIITPIFLFWLMTYLTYDEHKNCLGTQHRHVDGYLGFGLFSVFWFYAVIFFVFVEQWIKIIRTFKKRP